MLSTLITRCRDTLPRSDLRPLPSSEAVHGASEARRSGPQHRPDLILWLRPHRLQPPGLDGSARDRSPWRVPSAAWHSSGPPWGSRVAGPTSRDTAQGSDHGWRGADAATYSGVH